MRSEGKTDKLCGKSVYLYSFLSSEMLLRVLFSLFGRKDKQNMFNFV